MTPKETVSFLLPSHASKMDGWRSALSIPAHTKYELTDLCCGWKKLSNLLLGWTASHTTTLPNDNELSNIPAKTGTLEITNTQSRQRPQALSYFLTIESCKLITGKSCDSFASKPLQLYNTSKLELQMNKVLLHLSNIRNNEQMNERWTV